MPRSVKVRAECIVRVKTALMRNAYISQRLLAEDLGISQSTVSNFLNGKPVDHSYFQEICEKLALQWQEIADLKLPTEDILPSPSPLPPPEDNHREDTHKDGNHKAYPYPITSLEYPEGQVAISSPFYLERPPIEQRCYEEISKPGSLIRIKAPRQMGKTSLLTRILHEGEQQGNAIVDLSLQLASQQCFANTNKFFQWFCASVGMELKIPNKLKDYWDLADIVGSNMTCKAYFEEYLLPEIGKPLTLGLDEVDRVFEYPEIYKDFFGLLRAIHEEGKRRHIWKQIRLVIVHSTEVYLPMDVHQSPFNVGLTVELPEFTTEQVIYIAHNHQLNWTATEAKQLMALVGGHPFLIRLGLYHIARGDISLTHLLPTSSTATSIYSDHLHHQESLLAEQPELATAMGEIVNANGRVRLKSPTFFKLQGLGLVKQQGDEITPSCELYRQYFRDY